MIPDSECQGCQLKIVVKMIDFTNLGKFSASSNVTVNPSWARHAAEYEPAGPPPMTRIEQDAGYKIVMSPGKRDSV